MEPQKQNDLFFTCSIIELIARETKNRRKLVVDLLGEKLIRHLYELADVYHCMNPLEVVEEFLEKCSIPEGNYDCDSYCYYRIPTFWEIGRVYQYLIYSVIQPNEEVIEKTVEVLSSFLVDEITNFNSSLFYSNPGYLRECYLEGEILSDD